MEDKLYRLMNWPEIESIVYSESDNPHALLGPHRAGNGTLLQAFFPGAAGALVRRRDTGKEYMMEMADEEGYFAALIPEKETFPYEYQIKYKEGEIVREDPYRFSPVITKKDTDKFNAGIHYTAYNILGAHLMEIDGTCGVHFAVWAPNAMRVSVVGDFNSWDGRLHQMRRLWDSGIFEIFIPDITQGENYKFELKIRGGLTYLKADPYAFGQQLRPETASVVRDIEDFVWEDGDFLENRAKIQGENSPISIYELYLGSFKKPEKEGAYYNYRELAEAIIPYVKEMGYTHIELMPIMEHPFDGSWGYQVIGYYAPTSRYGTPEDFMYFMNEMHKAGIGVILDWVPAHFPRDTHGLSGFDGTCLYEHKDPRKGFHPHWGTLIYNYGRPEVCNYLIANALFWVEKYHVDGIRMDAVASMLYLDYGKQDGEWVANMYGGNENLEAVEFLKHLNSVLHKRGKGALSIAEESTAWPQITEKLENGGLGFDLKWNMGWMNDYLEYIKFDPYFRAHHHGELTFSMIYAYSERFILVFSHDEVVHGKATMLGKMPGERADKFANLRLTYAYMMAHPGKKLLFMGQDIGEFDEWNENRQVEWELLAYDEHKQLNRLVQDLNRFYKENPALYALDTDSEGFEWINSISANECVLVFARKSEKPEDTLLIAVNFANAEWDMHKIGVPIPGKYKEIFNTDAVEYGGKGRINARMKASRYEECDGREFSVKITLAPLSMCIFKCVPYTKEEQAALMQKPSKKETAVKNPVTKKSGTKAKLSKTEKTAVTAKAGAAKKAGLVKKAGAVKGKTVKETAAAKRKTGRKED